MDRAADAGDVTRNQPASQQAGGKACLIRYDGAQRPLHALFGADPSRRMAAAPEHRDALLRLLSARTPACGELATVLVRDPALLHALLEAAPLAGQRLASTLEAEVAHRLDVLGADLLRVWLMRQLWSAPPAPAVAGDAAQALLVAECARHLALETRYAYPDEAYLAGLWHALGARAADAEPAGTLAARCGVPMALADAVAFHHPLDEAHLSAHPLVRLLWAAKRLAQPDWQRHLDRVAQACKLPVEALLSLRTDVAYLAAGTGATPGTAISPVTAGGHEPPAGAAMQQFVMAGLARSAFFGLDEKAIGPRLLLASRLLCGEAGAPLVLVPDERDHLQALALCQPAHLLEWYAELELRVDDETSVVALAARSRMPTFWFPMAAAAPRSARDWHLARSLGGLGIVCLPLQLSGKAGVAVLAATEGGAPHPDARALLVELLGAAAQVFDEEERRRNALREGMRRVEERYRDHARRIAHEASSPLTLVAGHLEMLAQRLPGVADSDGDFAALQRELDRVAALLRRAGDPAPEAGEAPECRVADVLQTLRAAYEETLFQRRSIHFELRAASVPAVAMPASALKQVLLNLFRNAAEALQPGGRFTVTVPGVVLANGVPCVELRLIDNGPGLPPERQSDLAAPRPSGKGDAHQGVGLSVVHELLAQWKATCLCRSQAGTGTSYQLFIPLVKSL